MASVTTMDRPGRWDRQFAAEIGDEMTDADVARLRRLPHLSEIDTSKFPERVPLDEILKNDARIRRFHPGEIVVREGDYGNSAFLVMNGRLQVVLAPDLPPEMIGRQQPRQKSFFAALADLWRNSWVPEVRDTARYERAALAEASADVSHNTVLQDVPAILDRHRTADLGAGALFGELAALGRVPRTATVFAEEGAECLEIRWQGLRELRRYDADWRRRIDETYRKNALSAHLSEVEMFASLDAATLQRVADRTLFETYGTFEWHMDYKRLREQSQAGPEQEPAIAHAGDYPDGLLLVRAGFARVSVPMGNGYRTLTYLGAGDEYGMSELYRSWSGERVTGLETTLTALGYVDVLRIPTDVLEEHVFPTLRKAPASRLEGIQERPLSNDSFTEWTVAHRFINGTEAMLIDLDRCVRCDDCVRACAAAHGGNPRFVRHGRVFDHWMMANACMHCADPVCMIGCPTGAIHRDLGTGMVVVNDATCIGCATCANACPYDNIRMVEIRDLDARPVVDPTTQQPIVKATKCDYCTGLPGGPACVRACPHDAMERVDVRDLDFLKES